MYIHTNTIRDTAGNVTLIAHGEVNGSLAASKIIRILSLSPPRNLNANSWSILSLELCM